jgi:predicted phage baseplate assembly protein
MTWWGREATDGDVATVGPDGTPVLFAGDRRTVSDAVRARIAAFTPTWIRPVEDAGEALVRLFGEQVETVLERLQRWPDKALVEFLITAGIAQRPSTPAVAIVAFTIEPAAGQSVLVPAGFQIGAQPAGGSDLVTFETDRDLVASPASIAALLVDEAGRVTPVPPGAASFLPFGENADNGHALWIGLDGTGVPGPQLTLGFEVLDSGSPPPAAAGGVAELSLPPGPLVAWQLLNGSTLEPAEVLFDQTASLTTAGVVELAVPRDWTPGVPDGSDAPVLRWLRGRIASGRYSAPPQLAGVLINATTASAAVTVRDEVLEPIVVGGQSYQLTRNPILPHTLILAIDEGDDLGGGLGGGGNADGTPDSGTVWREVDDLSQFGPDDRVFTLDAALGVVSLGDGVHGRAVPPGFRNVVARRYRFGGGSAGAVDAGMITEIISAAPFVTAVTNPHRASGGDDVEPIPDAILRGPEEVRARGRAVTLADYELMALATPEAAVRRTHAISGHPSYPQVPVTGVVGVLVVPSERGDGPPVADAPLLVRVADHLAASLAPLGVEVVAAAVDFHTVRVEARVVLDPGADVGQAIAQILAALDRYLDPLSGGNDGHGWPFGGPVLHSGVVRQIVAVKGVRAVPHLDLVVDGAVADDCADVAIPPHALVWPASHLVVPIDAGDDA